MEPWARAGLALIVLMVWAAIVWLNRDGDF